MNQDLHTRIHDELLAFLNREPSENEIMNGQTDINIMGKIRDKESIVLKDKVNKQETDIINLKKK